MNKKDKKEPLIVGRIFINKQECFLNNDGEWEIKSLLEERALEEGKAEWEESSIETFAKGKDFKETYTNAMESLMEELPL